MGGHVPPRYVRGVAEDVDSGLPTLPSCPWEFHAGHVTVARCPLPTCSTVVAAVQRVVSLAAQGAPCHDGTAGTRLPGQDSRVGGAPHPQQAANIRPCPTRALLCPSCRRQWWGEVGMCPTFQFIEGGHPTTGPSLPFSPQSEDSACRNKKHIYVLGSRIPFGAVLNL